MLLVLLGCTLEEPKSPRFDTDVFVPLGLQRAAGRDLIDDSAYIDGDSAGLSPLRFLLEGEVAPFRVGSLLDLDLPATALEAGFDSIRVLPPATIVEPFSLGDLSGLAIPTGIPLEVPAFTFPEISRSLPPQDSFAWLRLASGEAVITLTNTLPISLGSEGAGGIGLRLRNRSTGSLVVESGLVGRLPPDATQSVHIPLAGLGLEGQIDLEIAGASEGSGGAAVILDPGDGLAVGVAFLNVTADSALAAVPPQALEVDGRVALSNDASIRILSAEVLEGGLSFTIANPFSLAASGSLTWTGATRGGAPLAVDFTVGPSSLSNLGIDLAGTSFTLPSPTGDVPFHLRLSTEGSGDRFVAIGTARRARLTSQPARVRFERLEGTLLERRLQIPESSVAIDPPEGLDQFSFEAAELALDVENGVALPARATLTLRGAPEQGAPIEVPLQFQVEPATSEGPVTTSFRIDESFLGLLDLIHARPRTLSLSGSLFAGTGTETAVVRRDDEVRARYRLSAPLRARIGRIDHRSDPFRFNVAADVQEHIRDELVEASVEGSIENRFPASLVATLSFAATSAGLDSADVTLDPIAVDLPAIDPATGRATAPSTRPFRLEINPADLSFFARDAIWGRVVLSVEGDTTRAVEITAGDYIEVSGMLRFRIRVGS